MCNQSCIVPIREPGSCIAGFWSSRKASAYGVPGHGAPGYSTVNRSALCSLNFAVRKSPLPQIPR
jgi:hypothetical protein